MFVNKASKDSNQSVYLRVVLRNHLVLRYPRLQNIYILSQHELLTDLVKPFDLNNLPIISFSLMPLITKIESNNRSSV